MFQQIVILDLAHNWNDSWVEKSNAAEAEEIGSGKKWLGAILCSSAILFLGVTAMLIYMFVDFTGCTINNTFISLTLIFCVALTTAQMTGDEGSLLGSGCISAWACFLCYTAVSMNPDPSCNPRMGESSPLRIAFGLTVSLISLCWTGWSYTAEDKLSVPTTTTQQQQQSAASNYVSEEAANEKKKVTGIVTGGSGDTEANNDYGAVDNSPAEGPSDTGGATDSESTTEDTNPRRLSNSWRLNIALVAVVCWSAMSLTHWGEIQSNGTLANPNVGRVGMWMVIGSQWFVMTLYVWTLMAPRLFPDRDFS